MSLAVRLTAIVCILLLIVFFGAIRWASNQESLWTGLEKLATDPWGIVTLIDLYVGFAVIGAVIVVTETRRWRAPIWIVLLCCLGNIVTLAYLLFQLRRARRFADLFQPTGRNGATLPDGKPLPR